MTTSPKMIDLDTGRGMNTPKQMTGTAPAYFLSAFRERKSLRGYIMKDREPFASLAEALKAADSLARALTINTAVPWMTGIRGGEIVKMTLAAPTPSTSHDHEARLWWHINIAMTDECRTILIESRATAIADGYTGGAEPVTTSYNT